MSDERFKGIWSLHETEKPELCSRDRECGPWRVVKCDDVTDVVECAKCGKQRMAPCNFDEDMS